jgi:hypothetical protein
MTSNYERSWDRAELARQLPGVPNAERERFYAWLEAGAAAADPEMIQRILTSADRGDVQALLRRLADDNDLPPTASA